MTRETFEAYVASIRRGPDECWEWGKSRGHYGHGQVSYEGRRTNAHRIMAHLVHGLDLANPKQCALHRCDNPPCVNPAHLWIGTQQDNIADMIAKGRKGKAKPKPPWSPSAEHLQRIEANRAAWRAGEPMPFPGPVRA